MKQLTCEMCGSTDLVKQDGVFVCQSCGCKYSIEEVRKMMVEGTVEVAGTVKVDSTAQIQNYLELSRNAYASGNGQTALDYANRALEVDSQCVEGWILKMKATSLSATAGDPKFVELFICGNNAIKLATDDQKEETAFRVNEFYLDFAHTLMLTAISMVSDTGRVSNLFKAAGVSLAAISAVQQGDAQARGTFEQIANNAINLKNSIELKEIENNEEFQGKVKRLAELYVEYCKADQERTKIYGLTPEDLNPEATTIRRKNLALITRGLKEENSISETEIDHSKSGCYVATCVYGSYDCPQVWTLRRFRDYTLAETWYGRAFICTYYAISPMLVKWFGHTEWFKKMWKGKLDRMVANLNAKGVENTPYEDRNW